MAQEQEKGENDPIFLRLPPELRKHVKRKTEEVNKKRRQSLEKPINIQDTIREIIRQDAVRSG